MSFAASKDPDHRIRPIDWLMLLLAAGLALGAWRIEGR